MIFADWLTRFFTPVHVLLMMEGGIGFIAGICIGFVAKNFGRIIAYGVAALILLLLVLSYSGIITINYPVIKQMFGIPTKSGLHDVLSLYGELAKLRVVGLSSGFIGAIIGWKIG